MSHLNRFTFRFALAAVVGALGLSSITIPGFAQPVRSAGEKQPSIISLAPAIRPQAQRLARTPGDATFQNEPANYHVFSAADLGEDAGVERITLNFAGETRLTRIESKSEDFVVEPGGTCHEDNSYAKGGSCSVLVRFNPQGPGHRLGHLEVSNSTEADPLFVGLVGNGYAPVISFTPSIISTVASTVSAGTGLIKSATNIAVDGGDVVYIPDTGNNRVAKIDSTGNLVNTANSPIATPTSLAPDSFGILYTSNVTGSTYYFSVYYPWGSETAYGYTHTAGTCTPSAPCAFSAVGMSSPANMSMDAYDDLFFEDGTKGAAEMPVSSISGGSGAFNLWYLSDQFAYSSGSAGAFAVDAGGNLYTDYNFTSTGICFILEEPLYNAEYSPTANRVAGGAKCGFSGDGGSARSAEISSSVGGIAFDNAGNLYFTDAGNQRVRRIDYSTGQINTIAGTGVAGYQGDGTQATYAQLSSPTGLAVDSQGQVYVLSNAPSAGPTQVIRKIGPNGMLQFAGVMKGTSSPAHVVTVSNTGNSEMTLASTSFTGAAPGDYSVDPLTTTCLLTTGSVLSAGQSCKVGILFKPTVSGLRNANFVLNNNTVTGMNTVLLTGTGTLPVPTMTITSPAPGTSVVSGTAVAFKVSVTSASGPTPSGTVSFLADGASTGSPVALSAGSASTNVTLSTVGVHTLSASYSGDSNYAAAGPVTRTYTVTAPPAMLPVKVALARATGAAQSCSATTFDVAVTSTSKTPPIGQVQLLRGGKVIATGTLVKGKITIKTSLPRASTVTLSAHYLGGAHHPAANSAPLKVTTSISTPCLVK